MDSNTIDSVIVDDTYTQWQDIYNRIKPGGNLLIISTPLKYHRVVINAEDNGFEVRDMIQYITEDGVYTIGLCRKPLSEKSVVDNVFRWGVGGLNIDGCRIGEGTGETKTITQKGAKFKTWSNDPLETRWYEQGFNKSEGNTYEVKDLGRWPANLILDKEAGKILDKQSGTTKSSKRGAHNNKKTEHTNTYTPPQAMYSDDNTYGDSGGASRFFASLDTKTELLEYLTKLINPKNGIIYIATS